ncbi:MAG: transglycosylase SLT domain-containing protein [Methylococcales bacterium]|nr:transglycosylase SLT domain-containing protein [Methylococcales bacterium]
MWVNFNRSVNFLLISITLIATGCSETSKEPVKINDQIPVKTYKPYKNNGYVYHPYRALPKYKFKTAATHKNTVWERLFSLYSLPEINNSRIDRELYWYLEHPASLAILQQRAEPYLHHILDEIEAKNIPGELALLPIVESAFIPDAYSKADASGLWQFIPSTGQEFGLQQNAWYDGRRDVYASTKAATTYLRQLSETFDGDWLLALASYNCGKGRVRKSIEQNEYRNLPSDFWSLDLPEETQNYVPRLLAVAKLFANADEYNIHLQHIPNKPYFEVVDIKYPIDLHKAAQLANTPLDKFLKLNPGFNRSCTAPEGPHRLLVPVAEAQSFKRSLALLPYSERVNTMAYYDNQVAHVYNQERDEEQVARIGQEVTGTSFSQYKAKPSESLGSLTEDDHAAIKSTRRMNNFAANSTHSGMRQLPAESKYSSVRLLAKASKNKSANVQLYAIKKGDTFFNISQRFSVAPKDIAHWNNITLRTALIPGRKLTIKNINPQLASTSSSTRLISYKVGKGDTLTQISRKFNVSVADIRKSNTAILARGLQSGQKLKIIIDGQPTT